MGVINDCKEGGVPATLLLPIRPWDQPDSDGKNAGKSVAQVNNNGEWVGLPKWQHGVLPEALDLADRMGGNAGLMLGCPESANDAVWNFAAIDIDLNAGNEFHRDRLVHAFAAKWQGQVLLVRETVPYRALLLVRITNTASIGRKSVYNLFYGDPTDKDAPILSIGKIELLATGQQAVIAGTHHSGNLISWHVYGKDKAYRVPVLNGWDGVPPIPAFATFPDLSESISNTLNDLSQSGYQHETKIGGAGELVPEGQLAPHWLTPEKLCALIDRIPNGESVDREIYVDVMMAISAARVGISKHHGSLSESTESMIGVSAARWASKWPNPDMPPGISAYDAEYAKWQEDWSHYTGDFHTSWDRLVHLAAELGLRDIAFEYAQEEFQADGPAPPPEVKDIYGALPAADDDLIPVVTPRPGEVLNDIGGSLLSDYTVSDYVRETCHMEQNVRYISYAGEWMFWDNRHGWIKTDTSTSSVMWAIMQCIKKYVKQYSGAGTPNAWKPGQINSMLSESRTRTVANILKHYTAASMTEIDQAPGFLQTPTMTFNLAHMEKIPLRVRWGMKDTRRVATEPVWNSDTPLFDNLLNLLSDGNPDIVDWLWHYFGYALIGDPKAQCFLILWGAGGNGKGTLAKVLQSIFGSYGCSLENTVLLESGKNLHKTELNVIRGKRLAIVAEMPKNEKWNESILKKLTGEDDISARNMRENASTFRSEAAIIIHCNDLPSFNRITPAILRRFRLVGTMNKPQNVDPDYGEKIIAYESAAILGKCMMYAKKVLANGMRLPEMPESMEAQRREALAVNDVFFAWLQSECITGPSVADEKEDFEELRSRYEKFLTRTAKEQGGGMVADKVSPKAFRAYLRDRGVRVADGKGKPLMGRRSLPNGTSVDFSYAQGILLKVKQVA